MKIKVSNVNTPNWKEVTVKSRIPEELEDVYKRQIIKNKESALRMEVKRCKTEAADLEDRLEQQIQDYEAMFAL